jgi:predicted metal-dependent phosphoesterase TrpH
LQPAELVELARRHKIDVIAITDHDTTGGLAAAVAAAEGSPFLIPGIELSTEYQGEDVDILGYFIDPAETAFQERLGQLRAGRIKRARAMVELLERLNVPIAFERVLELAKGGSMCRPHLAQALVEAGHVEHISEAFQRYLGNGRLAYLPGQKLKPEEAIRLLHGAGGVAVLAHPALVTDYAAVVEKLVPMGLDGVEVLHPRNPMPVRANLRALAKRYKLVITGGSDFHRPGEGQIGSETLPPGVVAALRERAGRWQR